MSNKNNPASASSSCSHRPAPLCRFFFVNDSCRFGKECLYSHNLPEGIGSKEEALKFIPCPFFRNGNCKYGDHCQLQHCYTTKDSNTSSSSSPSHDSHHHPTKDQETITTCGICLEDKTIGTTLFGILNCACQNTYCYKCIMEWRTEGSDEAADRTCCPSCRQKISYVFPSPMLPKSTEEKEKIIQEYTERVGQIPCKFFDGNLGSCQYGSDCLYAHLDEDGKDCKKEDLSMEMLYEMRTIKSLRQRIHMEYMDWVHERFLAYMAFGNESSDDDYDEDDDDDDDEIDEDFIDYGLLRFFDVMAMME